MHHHYNLLSNSLSTNQKHLVVSDSHGLFYLLYESFVLVVKQNEYLKVIDNVMEL